jgi:hypothetical protein
MRPTVIVFGCRGAIREIADRAQASRRTDAQAGERRQVRGPKPYGYYDGKAAALDRLKALRAEGHTPYC